MGFKFFNREEPTGYIVEVFDAPAGGAALSRDSQQEVRETIAAENQNSNVIKIRVVERSSGKDITSQFQEAE